MPRPKLVLTPSWDETHSRLQLTATLPRALTWWELVDLISALRAWTRQSLRVALPAGAPPEWLDEWVEVVADAAPHVEQVAFVVRRRGRGGRHDR
jgi:hypothetical protein